MRFNSFRWFATGDELEPLSSAPSSLDSFDARPGAGKMTRNGAAGSPLMMSVAEKQYDVGSRFENCEICCV